MEPNSGATPQGLDQRSKFEKVVPKMVRWRGSDADSPVEGELDPAERTTPTSRRLIVVVRFPPLYREVGRNGNTTISRGQTIRSPPIIWNSHS